MQHRLNTDKSGKILTMLLGTVTYTNTAAGSSGYIQLANAFPQGVTILGVYADTGNVGAANGLVTNVIYARPGSKPYVSYYAPKAITQACEVQYYGVYTES